MKACLSLAVVALAVAWSTTVRAESQSGDPRMEMQKCEVCKFLAEKPDLMKQMTWETHKIDNGMISVASGPKENKDEFHAVHEKMMQAVAKVKADQQQGKPVQLCEYCQSMSELMKAGAKQQNIETAGGAICLVTSDDPAVVQKIHAAADKAIAQQQQMEQQLRSQASQ
jgi:uncharacterized membrane-anchored protein YhcB (DUF1043 family)